ARMNLVWQFFAAVLATISLLSWAWMAARLRRGEPLLIAEPRRPVPWQAVDLLIIALVFAAALVLLAMGLNVTLAEPDDDLKRFEIAVGASLAANAITVAFAVVWLASRVGAKASDLGWCGETAGRDVRTGLVAFAAVSGPIYGMQALLSQFTSEQHPIIEMLAKHSSGWLFALCGISAVVAAPLAEEFLFRGLLQGWLESLPFKSQPAGAGPIAAVGAPADSNDDASMPATRAGTTGPLADHDQMGPGENNSQDAPKGQLGAIVLTSAIFALMHWGHGFAPVPLFFLSLALGWLYQRTHRLLPSVVLHFCVNGCSFLMLPLALSERAQ
ncbi:MAG: lysostaphin resistance A-like protein, partial [Candidatus Saccharimonadales bacterium]